MSCLKSHSIENNERAARVYAVTLKNFNVLLEGTMLSRRTMFATGREGKLFVVCYVVNHS